MIFQVKKRRDVPENNIKISGEIFYDDRQNDKCKSSLHLNVTHKQINQPTVVTYISTVHWFSSSSKDQFKERFNRMQIIPFFLSSSIKRGQVASSVSHHFIGIYRSYHYNMKYKCTLECTESNVFKIINDTFNLRTVATKWMVLNFVYAIYTCECTYFWN